MELNLQLEKAIESIKTEKPTNLLLQLPDGIKPKAKEIIEAITKDTDLTMEDIVIWAGSCYGACDVPEVSGFDMLLQFGHSRWVK